MFTRPTHISNVDGEVEAALAGSFLASVPRSLLPQILARSTIREIPAGRIFISDSEPPQCGILVTGLARVYVRRPNGALVTLRRVGPAAAIGVRATPGRRNQATRRPSPTAPSFASTAPRSCRSRDPSRRWAGRWPKSSTVG